MKSKQNLQCLRKLTLAALLLTLGISPKRGPKPVEPVADPEKLYTEIGRLKVELDWLKKKSGLSL